MDLNITESENNFISLEMGVTVVSVMCVYLYARVYVCVVWQLTKEALKGLFFLGFYFNSS